MALTLQTVLKLSANAKTFLRGQMYYQKKKISEFSSRINKNGKTSIYAEVAGAESRYVEIVLDENENIVEYVCSCPGFSASPGACKHIVAVLTNYLTQKNPGAANIKATNIDLGALSNPKPAIAPLNSNPVVRQLLDAYSFEYAPVNDDTNFTLTKLFATLVFNKSAPTLTFKIGTDRPYPIVNITKFCEDILSKSERDYGKLFKVVHTLDSFDEQSRRLIDIILDAYNFELEKNAPKSQVNVNAVMLDKVFDIYTNQQMTINRGGEDEIYTIIDDNPLLNLSVIKNLDNSYTVNCEPFFLMSGFTHIYIGRQKLIYSCNAAYKNEVYSFLTSLLQSADFSINIPAADASTFFCRVLSQIRSFFTLSNDIPFLNDILPDILTSKVYLDEPKKGIVTAKLEYWYNDIMVSDDKVFTDIKRDEYSEKRMGHILGRYFPNFSEINGLYVLSNEDKILNFIKSGLACLSQYAQIFTTANFNRLKLADYPKVSIGVSLENNLICLSLEIGEAKSSELVAILESYKQNKPYHQLENGTFIRVDNKQFAKIEQLLAGLNLSNTELKSKKIKVQKYRAFFLNTFLQNDNTFSVRRSEEFDEFINKLSGIKNEKIEIPPSLDGVLREYQVTGYKWLKTVTGYGFSCILADDMGLGKTLQVIALLLSGSRDRTRPSLVVCPSSLTYNWESEIAKFGSELKSLVISGNAVKRQTLLSDLTGIDVVITSYDQLKRDIDLYSEYTFEYHIIDEAQFIKNHSTLNSKSVGKVNSEVRIALTGTPIENQLSELWSIFNFLMPGYLFTYKHFKTYFEAPITREKDSRTLTALTSTISPFILRRMKKNVLTELPDKNEISVVTPLDEQQENLYNASIITARDFIKQKIEENALETNQIGILSLLTKLRQICCDPRLCFDNYEHNSAKLEACMDIVTSAVRGGHKVLIFSQFTSMLAIIEKELKKNKISSFLLQGSTPTKNRLEMVDRFNSDSTNVFLISLKAGGTGLNLTGADIVIHYDPWWNLAAQNQATDRAYRIGQKNSVTVYKLIAKDTIEERICAMQQSKHSLAESVISNADGVVAKLSMSDITSLFDINY